MKRLILACALLLSLQTTAQKSNPSSTLKLVEKIATKKGEPTIPYEQYILPNGLTVLIHEDHSDPLVNVNVTYHVGSQREEIGKTGFAHFFEHMMFEGSDHVKNGQFADVIHAGGGVYQGETHNDYTEYYETIPVNQLEKVLWMEADRMGFLLDSVTQKAFEVQRETVKNERAEKLDNRPFGLLESTWDENLYPYGHPYSWHRIGYIEDLNRVDVNDLKHFFLRWYSPNNAVLIIGGDVQTKEVIRWVEKYFGTIPKGPEVKQMKLPVPVLEKDRYVHGIDNFAQFPVLEVLYSAAPAYNKDEAALECLAQILGQGNSSLLYQNMIKTGEASNLYASNLTSELAGELRFEIFPAPGKKMADLEKSLRNTLAEFEKRGATDEDIQKFRTNAEVNTIRSLENVENRMKTLAHYFTYNRNANLIAQQLKRYTSVTKEDVMRVYNTYIKDKHALIISWTVKGQEDNIVAPDNYAPKKDPAYKAPYYGYDTLSYHKAKDNFDRSAMPVAGPVPAITVPAFWKKDLADGIKVMGTQSAETPAVRIYIQLTGGKILDGKDPAKKGLSNFFVAMMNGEDTRLHTGEQFNSALQKLGGQISIDQHLDKTNIYIYALRNKLDGVLALVKERLLEPKFTEEAFNRNKIQILEGIKQGFTQPEYIASNAFTNVLFGKSNIMAWPASGTEASISNIKLQDIQQYYDSYMSKTGALVTVAGDITEQEILPKLAFLQLLPSKNIQLPELTQEPVIEKTKIYLIDVPGADQTQFRIGTMTGLKYDVMGDYYKMQIVNRPLGAGGTEDRLNHELRESKGWTYGSGTEVIGSKYYGFFGFGSGIKAEATDSALVEIIDILKAYKAKGMTKEELKNSQTAMGQSDALNYEGGNSKLDFLANMQYYNLTGDYTQKQNKILNSINLNEANTLAAKYIPDVNKMCIVLVGDKVKLLEGLKKTDYEILELDIEGNPVKLK